MTRIEAVRGILADRFHQRPEVAGLIVSRQRDQQPGGGRAGVADGSGTARLFPCGCRVEDGDPVARPGEVGA